MNCRASHLLLLLLHCPSVAVANFVLPISLSLSVSLLSINQINSINFGLNVIFHSSILRSTVYFLFLLTHILTPALIDR